MRPADVRWPDASWPLAARAMGVAALAWALASAAGEAVVRPCLPLVAWMVHTLDDTWAVTTTTLGPVAGEPAITLVARVAHCLVRDDQVACLPHTAWAQASTPLAHLQWMTVVALTTVVAWPLCAGWREAAWRAVLLAPALALGWAMDTPLVLHAALAQTVADTLTGGGAGPTPGTPWTVWAQVLDGGGRVAMAAVLGALVVRGAWRMARSP